VGERKPVDGGDAGSGCARQRLSLTAGVSVRAPSSSSHLAPTARAPRHHIATCMLKAVTAL
jgi:hypothetical protein